MKKIIGICVIVGGILLSSSVVYNESKGELRNVTREEQLEVFEKARKQAKVEENCIEHVTEVQSDGYVMDMYVDRANYLQQVDTYENNQFLDRMILNCEAGQLLSVGRDNNEYRASITMQDESIVIENRKIFEEYSQFENYIKDSLNEGKNTFFREEKTSDSSVIKYTSKNLNLYFDKESKYLLKKENIVGKEITKVTKFEKIEKTSDFGRRLFKKGAPLILGNNINLSNIKTDNIKQEIEVPLEEARG